MNDNHKYECTNVNKDIAVINLGFADWLFPAKGRKSIEAKFIMNTAIPPSTITEIKIAINVKMKFKMG